MDTDTHGCGVPASSRSTGRRLEQNCMVMFWQNAILELQPQGCLARAPAAEIDAAGRSDLPETAVGDVELRVAQVHAVCNVRERAFELQRRPFGDRVALARSRVPAKRTRSQNDADAGVTETGDGRRIAARHHTHRAVKLVCPHRSAGTQESVAIEPYIARRIGKIAVCDAIRTCRAAVRAVGARGVAATH